MWSISVKYPQKRAFVTGAGSGLGKALSLELAKDQWTVGICDINEAALGQTEQMLRAYGIDVFAYLLDVASAVSYENVAHLFLENAGGIDLLINNAGVGEGTLFEDYSLENWEWIIGVNQKGVLNGCHYFVPVMKRQGGGCILNIASAAGFANMPKMSPYNVTKAAVIALSESLWVELKSHGVQVSVAVPTFFRSSILEHARGDALLKEKASAIVLSSRWDSSRAAEAIFRGISKKCFWIVFPWEGRMIWWVKRLSPALYRRLILWMFG